MTSGAPTNAMIRKHHALRRDKRGAGGAFDFGFTLERLMKGRARRSARAVLEKYCGCGVAYASAARAERRALPSSAKADPVSY